jgi:hypothetical protein
MVWKQMKRTVCERNDFLRPQLAADVCDKELKGLFIQYVPKYTVLLIPLSIHVKAPCMTEPSQILKKWSDHNVSVELRAPSSSSSMK